MQIIGANATYTGTAHPWMTGLTVKVNSIIRGADDGFVIRSDEDLQRLGGLKDRDVLDVSPWMTKEGRFSWVTSDATADELTFEG
jgi:hypothetical protein